MRIIEGMGPPTQDTFGNSAYLYKDTETGAFYRCHGNINEVRTLPYFPAHKHPGEQYLWTPILYAETKAEPVLEYKGDFTLLYGATTATVDVSPEVANLQKVSAGDTVRVVFDGVEYFCEVIKFYDYGKGCGNMSMVTKSTSRPECWGGDGDELAEDTGEPFCLVFSDYYNPRMHFYAPTEGEHNFAVSKVFEDVHRLPAKYLPEGYPYSIIPEIKVELNSGTNYNGALRENCQFYHLSDTVFTKPEEVYGLYLMGYVQPYYYIDANGKCKWYNYNYQTSTLTYSNVTYEVVDVVDRNGEVVGFNMIFNESGRGENRDALCFIFKEARLGGWLIRPGIYHDIKSAPLPMVSLATYYETRHYRLASEYMPLLTDSSGGKWKLTVSTSGALSTERVYE